MGLRKADMEHAGDRVAAPTVRGWCRAVARVAALSLVPAAMGLNASAADAARRPIVTGPDLNGLPQLVGVTSVPTTGHHQRRRRPTPRPIRPPARPRADCREAIPAPSADVRETWRRFTVLVNTALCRGVDRGARRAAIAAMLEPSACVSIPQPVPSTPSAIATTCSKKVTFVINDAAMRPFPSRIDNLLIEGDRAYGDAVGNVRFEKVGSTWLLTELL
jgi:hypothetical protein